MSKITEKQVLKYIAESAEVVIEDDLNEAGNWSDEEHEELVALAMSWIGDHR